MQLIRDDHWLVRGLTLRMLADQYGPKVANILERYHQADPDGWVQQMAKSLHARVESTTEEVRSEK